MNVQSGIVRSAVLRLYKKINSLGCECCMDRLYDFILSDYGQHWKWRLTMAQEIANCLDFERYGVMRMYIIGSTKNAVAGPQSDIDFLIHHTADNGQAEALTEWIRQWGEVLGEINFYRTGLKVANLIDLHLITDEDIANKTSYAVMIGRTTDGARLLRSIK